MREKRKQREKRIWMGPAPQGKGLTTWESPCWQEISLEGELQSQRGEHSIFGTGKTEVTCTDSQYGHAMLPSLRCSSGLLEVGCTETAWRCWSVATESVCGTNLGAQERQGASAGGAGRGRGRTAQEGGRMQDQGQEHHRSFFPCSCAQTTGHCLQELWSSGCKPPLPSWAPGAGVGHRCCRENWEQALLTASIWHGSR